MSSVAAAPVGSVLVVAGRLPAFPPAREFVTSAGFGGAAALVAALLLAAVGLVAVRRAAKRHRLLLEQQESHYQQVRDDERHDASVERCWQRLVWVVETAGIEPASQGATVGLGPELALELLRGLLRDAEKLGDNTLAGAVRVYLSQFALVLAQQGSALSGLEAADSAVPSDADGQAAPDERPEPAVASPTPTGDVPTASDKVAVSGRRRRR